MFFGNVLILTNNVPVFDVEPEVDVEVLVVVVVEDAVRLPRLPEVSLEGDAGVVDDPVVVGVQQDNGERNWNELEIGFDFEKQNWTNSFFDNFLLVRQ